MPRAKRYLVLVAGLALASAVAYLAYRSRPQPSPEAKGVPGLAWLPAEAGLVAGVNLAEVRQQAWLLELLRQVAGETPVAADYQAFVEATGFDYSRDLDRLWVGVLGSSTEPVVVGVAEGRFARERILAYARQQAGRLTPHAGFEIYEVQTEVPEDPQRPRRSAERVPAARGFAFAFLDDTHLAFASDSRAAALVVDCWQGRAPAVGSEESRRTRIERRAAGQQVWVVDEFAKWQPGFVRDQESLQDLVAEAALGLRVSGEGLDVEAEAQCREAAQAERLYDNLRILLLAARLALGRQRDPGSQALADVLEELTLSQQGDTLQARVELPPETLAQLLGTSPKPPRAGE